MLSEAKHLLLFEYVGDKQILRFAQNDNLCVYTIRRNALEHHFPIGVDRDAVFDIFLTIKDVIPPAPSLSRGANARDLHFNPSLELQVRVPFPASRGYSPGLATPVPARPKPQAAFARSSLP